MKILIVGALLAAISLVPATASPSSTPSLLPEDVKLESWKGKWQRGGSGPKETCLKHFSRKYPTARV